MKPEIKAMLPDLPAQYKRGTERPYYNIDDIEAWLDKLTEGARVVYGFRGEDNLWGYRKDDAFTCTALLICPREIKKQTPLEIAKEYLELIADKMPSCNCMDAPGLAKDALEKIEAANG